MVLQMLAPSAAGLSAAYAAKYRRRGLPSATLAMRPGTQEPTVMASPPTVTFNDVSKIARTVTDAAITTGTATLTSATAAFTAGDKNRKVTVTGAGASGAVLTTYISSVTNATTVVLAVNASTTVSAASSTIGVKKVWPLTVPAPGTSLAGPARLTGALTFGRIPSGNGSYATLSSPAAIGDTTIQISEKAPGPTGKIATGAYRIDPPNTNLPTDMTVAEHQSGEDITITAVTGASAPYTATLSAALTKAHRANFVVSNTAALEGYNITSGIAGVGIWSGQGSGPVVETITDAPSVEFLVKAANSANTYRLWVDGQLVTASQQTAAYGGAGQPPANAYGYILLQFGTRKTRRIRYEASTMIPTAIVTDAQDSTYAPEECSTRVLWISDSYVATGAQTDGIAHQASRLLGWDCASVDQIGGTGYIADNGATASYAAQRLTSQVANAPDVVVIALGLNDSHTGTLTASITSYLKALKAALPYAKLYVVGPWSNGDGTNNSGSNVTKITVAQDVRDAAAAAGVPHIDTLLLGAKVVGTGKAGTPTFNGNADTVVDSDGTHPQRTGSGGIGEQFWAEVIANGIAAATPA